MPNGFLEINAADFEKTMAINLQSAVFLTKLVVPQMQAQKDGVIIYLASIAGVRGNKSIGLYGISKAGLIQLARNLAVEFGPDNIRVNTISPGMIDTPFSKSLIENKDFMEKRLLLTPLRRVGTPEEIAGVAVMLSSKAGDFNKIRISCGFIDIYFQQIVSSLFLIRKLRMVFCQFLKF